MFNMKTIEQRIIPEPYDYFEYKKFQNKQSIYDKLFFFICKPGVYLHNLYSEKSTSRISEITLVVIKCFNNLDYFFRNCFLFCLNKTGAYKFLKEKDFSERKASALDSIVPILFAGVEREIYLINNGMMSYDTDFEIKNYFTVMFLSKIPVGFLLYNKALDLFNKDYTLRFNKNNKLLISPSRIIAPIALSLVLVGGTILRSSNRFVDLSYSLLETTVIVCKVYQGLEECFALYKKKPKQSLVNAAFYSSYLALTLFKLYNVLNFRSYRAFSDPTQVDFKRVESLSDKLEERVKDSRLNPDCLEHNVQLINPKYEIKIEEYKKYDDNLEEKFQIKERIVPLNFTVSELKKTCNKYALAWHPDKCKSPECGEIAQRILEACNKIKNGLKQLT